MPTYDYQCSQCGHSFEAFQSMSDDPLKRCPKCQKNGLKRLIGGGLGVIFKGSGFYSTDSRSSSSAVSTSGGKSDGDGAKSDSGSSESKSTNDGAKKESGTKESGTKEKVSSKE